MNVTKNSKACPACGEDVLAIAKKCKHCGTDIENYRTISNNNDSNLIEKNPNYEIFLIVFPILASLLLWFFIAKANIIQDPFIAKSFLTFFVITIFVVTAAVASLEASHSGMKRDRNLGTNGPIAWLFILIFVWPLGYPAYLFKRKHYGLPNRIVAGILVVLILNGCVVLAKESVSRMSAEFESSQEEDNSSSETDSPKQDEQKNARAEAPEQSNAVTVNETDPSTTTKVTSAQETAAQLPPSAVRKVSVIVDGNSLAASESGDGFTFKSTQGKSYYVNSNSDTRVPGDEFITESGKTRSKICLSLDSPNGDMDDVVSVLRGACQ